MNIERQMWKPKKNELAYTRVDVVQNVCKSRGDDEKMLS